MAASSHDIFSLYANRSSQPSNNPRDCPSYLDFVRIMNDIEPPPTTPPPPYTPRLPVAAELPCPYSERRLKALKLEECEKQSRPKQLEVIYAHFIPLPTICVTPPGSTASSPTDSQCTTVFSPVLGVASATWPAGPPLRHKPTPRWESLREVRQRESEMWLKEVYERQTRHFLAATMWRGSRQG